jgi:hypothetical protein
MDYFIINFTARNPIANIMKTKYISPETEILDITPEGVLCASNETLEENEGEW